MGLWLSASTGRGAEDAPYSEDAVKAAYLHRFAAYVEWPASSSAHGPFVIGVMGSDDVLAQLQRLLPAINIKGREASARAVRKATDLEDVSLLYIGPGQLAAARPLLAAAAAHTVLVVTDDPRGLDAGAVINFVRRGSNLRFEVSQVAADRRGLKVDAALLAVAARVETR